MVKVCIIGALGTIGYHLTDKLSAQGQEITMVDSMARGKKDRCVEDLLDRPNVKFVLLDINNPEDFKKLDKDYDYVYHLAAINGTKNFYEKPVDVLRVGVQGTINVLDWFRTCDKGKIMFTSSNEAYASWINLTGGPIPTPESVPLCIEDIFNPRWSYGAGKLIGEVLFANYGKTYGFPYTIVRYHNNYGIRMGEDHVIPQLIRRIIKKEDPFIINGWEESRAFCYVDDTIRATQMVMESDKTNGQVINIGNDKEEIKMGFLARDLMKIFEFEPHETIMNKAPEGCVKRRCPDLTKIRNLVGYEPSVMLKEGLEKTCKWYRSNNI